MVAVNHRLIPLGSTRGTVVSTRCGHTKCRNPTPRNVPLCTVRTGRVAATITGVGTNDFHWAYRGGGNPHGCPPPWSYR